MSEPSWLLEMADPAQPSGAGDEPDWLKDMAEPVEAAPAAEEGERPGFFSQVGNQLLSGDANEMATGYATTINELRNYDALPWYKRAKYPSDPAEREAKVNELLPELERWTGNIAQYESERAAPTAGQRAISEAPTLGAALKTAAANPGDALGLVGPSAAASLIDLPQVVAAGLTMGPKGAATAAGVSAYGQDYKASVLDGLRDIGVDPSSAPMLMEAMQKADALIASQEAAKKRAMVVGGASALGTAVAGKMLTPFMKAGVGREVANVGAQIPTQAVIEGGGEALAQQASGEGYKPGEVAAEMLGGGVTAPVDVAQAAIAGYKQKGPDTQGLAAAAQARAAYEATFTQTDDGQGGTTFVDGAGNPVGDTLDEARATAARLTPEELAGRMAKVQPAPAPGQPDLRLGLPEAQPKPNVSALPPGYMEAAAQPPLEPLRTPTAADTQTPGSGSISDAELAGAGVDTSELGPLERPSYVAPGKAEIPARDLKDAAEREQALPELEPVRAPVEAQPKITDAELAGAGIDTKELGDVRAPAAPASPGKATIPEAELRAEREQRLEELEKPSAATERQADITDAELAAAGVDTAALGDVAAPTAEPKAAAAKVEGVPRPTNVQDDTFDVNGEPAEIRKLYEVKGGVRIKNGLRFPKKLLPEFEQRAEAISAAPPVDTSTLGEVAPLEPSNGVRDAANAVPAGRAGSVDGLPVRSAGPTSVEQVGDGADLGRVPDERDAGSGYAGSVAASPTAPGALANGRKPDEALNKRSPMLRGPAAQPAAAPTQEKGNEEVSAQGQEPQRDGTSGSQVRGEQAQAQEEIADAAPRIDEGSKPQAPDADGKKASEKPSEFTSETGTAPDAAPATSEAWKGKKGAARLQALVEKSKDVPADAYEDARLPGYMGEAVEAMARLFKKDVVVFRAKPGTAYAPGGLLFPADPSTIYLNADANVAPAVVFMHEMVHSMKRTDPKTYAALEKAVGKLLKNKKGYVEFRLRGKKLSDELVTEEMIADVMADHASNPQFWSDLYGRFDNKSAWNKLVDYVRSLMSNVIDTLYPIGANNYISDFNAAYQAVVDAAYNHARAQHGDVASNEAPLESAMLSSAQGSPPPTDASRALSALRGTDPSLYGRAKKLWKQGFFPGGLLRGDVAKRNFERQAKIAGISYEAGNAVGNLERAVEAAYDKEFSKLSEADMRDIQAALTGKVPENMPAQVKQAVVAMRQMIDRQSRDYIQILREQIAVKMANDKDVANDVRLLNTITNNLESYAFRSYKAFDDPNWWKTVKKDVVERAVTFIADGYVAQGMTQADAVTRANQRVAEFKTGSAADSMESFIKESKLGGKDLSVLMRRKDIPIPIRDLLGEYVDPRVNFTKSIAKMGRLVQNQRFLESVRDMGMGSLLWEKDDLSRPAEARTPVAAEGSDTYSPLNGLMTTDEFAEALKDATAKAQIDGWYKWVVGANAMVNYGKTVLSPTTQVRNFLSAALFTAANGHFNYARLADATNAVKARFAGPAKRAAAQKYIKELIDLGVLHDNASAGDFQTYLESSGVERLFDPDTVAGKVNSGVKSLYQFSDDFWKIVGYENELAAQKRAGLSEEAAKLEAAERIRNTYPTYSMAGKAIKALARSPVAGAFPTFSAEIVRNTYHIIRYAKHDIQEGIRTGNKAQALNGARRVAGIALMASAVYMLQAYSANSIGLDDDEEEALRQLMPSWQQNSNMFWLKRDEYGRPTYMDMSWMDVYGIWKRPINAIMRDQPLDDAFKQGAIEFLSPFLGADILIQAVVEAGMNKKFGTGAPVYSEATKAEDIANHIRKAVQPGIAGNAERIYRAADGQTKPGGVGEYSLGEEALAFAGLRVSSVDPALGLRSKGYDFAKATQESGQGLRRTLSSPNDVSEAEIDDQMEAAIRLHNEANARTRRTVEAAMKAGLSANQALRILDGSGISKKRAQALVQGKSMPFELSDRALKDALDRAASIPGRKDNRAEIKKRYNYAERRLKELQRGQ